MSLTPRPHVRESSSMARWTAQKTLTGRPADVLMLLTEPEAISRWAPIDFDVVGWEGERLGPGEHVRVRGRLAGQSLEFAVDVAEADDNHLTLTASGPIDLDVEYHALALDSGSELRASVDVRGRG